jgi:hypothetical protein
MAAIMNESFKASCCQPNVSLGARDYYWKKNGRRGFGEK